MAKYVPPMAGTPRVATAQMRSGDMEKPRVVLILAGIVA